MSASGSVYLSADDRSFSYASSGSASLELGRRRDDEYSWDRSDCPAPPPSRSDSYASVEPPPPEWTWSWSYSDDGNEPANPYSQAERGMVVRNARREERIPRGPSRYVIWRGRACRLVFVALIAGSAYLTYWSGKQVIDSMQNQCDDGALDCYGGKGPNMGVPWSAFPRAASDPKTAIGIGVTGSELLLLLWMHCGQPPITCGTPPTLCERMTTLFFPNGGPC